MYLYKYQYDVINVNDESEKGTIYSDCKYKVGDIIHDNLRVIARYSRYGA